MIFQQRSISKIRALSLVEVLIVITIILVLAAIVLAAIQPAKRAALTAHCGSNLRQIGLASAIYAVDHDDRRAYAIDEIDLWSCNGGITTLDCDVRSDGMSIERLILTTAAFKQMTKCPMDTKPDPLYTSGVLRATSYTFSTVLFLGRMHPKESTAEQALAWDFDWFHGLGDERYNRVSVVFADGHAKNLDWDALHIKYTDQATE